MIFSSQRFLQKTNKQILLYYYETSGRLVFVRFLEEIEDTIKKFRNYLTFKRMLDYQNYQGIFFWNFCKSKSFDLDDFKWSENKVKTSANNKYWYVYKVHIVHSEFLLARWNETYRGSPTYTNVTNTVSTTMIFGLCMCKWGNHSPINTNLM